jgi:hypothetical protein
MTDRIRKAWRITIRGYDDPAIVHAETRAKAVYDLYAQMETDWPFGDFLRRVSAVREAQRDLRLPPRHPLAATLSAKILYCISHAYGGTGAKAGYRDHYYTHDNDPMPKAAYYHGLFEMHRVPRSFAGDRESVLYILTDLGRNVAAGEVETYPRW